MGIGNWETKAENYALGAAFTYCDAWYVHVYICSRYEYCILPVCLYGGVCAACRIGLASVTIFFFCRVWPQSVH